MNCKLALSRLMPEAQVKRISIEHEVAAKGKYWVSKETLIRDVMKKFNVSRELAVARLISLKIFSGTVL